MNEKDYDQDSDYSDTGTTIFKPGMKLYFSDGMAVPKDKDGARIYADFLHALYSPNAHENGIQFKHLGGIGRSAATGVFLGCTIGFCFAVLCYRAFFAQDTTYSWATILCLYLLMLSLYHILEFVTTAFYNPRIATADSFLINQSKAYVIACVASWIEFAVELIVFPSLKGYSVELLAVSSVGFILIAIGQFFRTGAMVTAGSNFTHLISFEKNETHKLVTNGIYAYLRHPSYFGWFWWSIGTQVLLRNPVCVVLYFFAAWKFFKERIPIEEVYLVKFFPEYAEYKRRTWIGIPFIG